LWLIVAAYGDAIKLTAVWTTLVCALCAWARVGRWPFFVTLCLGNEVIAKMTV
jgi:hypothetical protein